MLPVDTESFGSIGVFAIPEMGRFYRNVLIGKNYPHHGAVAFGHYGKILFEVFKYLGVEDVAFNQPKGMIYPGRILLFKAGGTRPVRPEDGEWECFG